MWRDVQRLKRYAAITRKNGPNATQNFMRAINTCENDECVREWCEPGDHPCTFLVVKMGWMTFNTM